MAKANDPKPAAVTSAAPAVPPVNPETAPANPETVAVPTSEGVETTPAAPAKTRKPRKVGVRDPQNPKSIGIGLKDSKGRIMRIVAMAAKDGSARSFVVVMGPKTTDAAGKNTRERQTGARKTHAVKNAESGVIDPKASIAEAVARTEKLRDTAVADGWKIGRSSAGGFRATADAFDENSLPKAE